MKKALSIAVGAAALMTAAPVAIAQNADYDYYVTGTTNERMVTNRTTGESTPLLLSENGQAPAECPSGSFWLEQRDEGTIADQGDLIRSCDDEQAVFEASPPDADMAMDNGEPFAEDAAIMRPVEYPSGSTRGEGAPDQGGG